MSTQVKNIKSNSYPISKETKELFKQIGALRHLPTAVPRDISFELHNTTTVLANSIKRCMNSEIPVLIMNFEQDDVSTDDDFIIRHEICKRVNLIPIRQISGVKFSLNVKNDTDQIIPVFSRSIIVIEEKTTTVDSKEEMFSPTQIICYLRPGKVMVIDNIHVKSGTSYADYVSHSFPGKIGFECIDEKELARSSLVATPTSYRITVPRQKFVDPKHIVKLALSTLLGKLDRIRGHVDGNTDDFYSVDNVEITRIKELTRYKLIGETYTVGNLLSTYGYLSDSSITHIHCIKQHPSHNFVIVEIHHSNPKAIMLSAIDLSKKELNAVLSKF
jgi:DNA-directed RNA polymerase subunit L